MIAIRHHHRATYELVPVTSWRRAPALRECAGRPVRRAYLEIWPAIESRSRCPCAVMRRPFAFGTFSTIFSFSSCEDERGVGTSQRSEVPRVVCSGVHAGADQGRPNEAHERAGSSRNVGVAPTPPRGG